MRIYAAPMEGITGYVFRNAHHQIFPGADRYYMPFLSPGAGCSLTSKERKDILPANNEGVPVVPQVLTNKADLFSGVAELLQEIGYREVNLNLGCPSGTVTSKKKGAGFLGEREELVRFLEAVFEEKENRFPELKISVKTRLGVEDPAEFQQLVPIFNRYPVEELTIHPRVRADFYKGTPRMEEFRLGLEQLKMPVCFNGNLFSAEDMEDFLKTYGMYENLQAVMLGRGMVASPWLLQEITGTKLSENETLEQFKAFHELLLQGYEETLSGDRHVLFKMKELWYYLGQHFPENHKGLKKIKKAQRVAEYRAAAEELLVPEWFEKDAKLYFT